MTLCRSCRHISVGSPSFCERCGRSFDAKLCPSRHESSATARFCSTCGSDDLSTATRSFRLTFAHRLFSRVCALLLIWIIARIAFCAIAAALCRQFGAAIQTILNLVLTWGSVWGFLALLGGMDSRAATTYVKFSTTLVSCLWSMLWATARLLGRLLSFGSRKC